MSLRAERVLRSAQHVAFFRKAGRWGHARRIVEGLLRPDAVEYPFEYPITTEIPVSDPRYNALLSAFYGQTTAQLEAIARAGHDVAVLCEGDPFFYGSFMHLHARLKGRVPVQVIPAITGMSAAWTATGQPIAWGDDVITVLAGTLDQARLEQHMRASDAVVVMKIGAHFPKVVRALQSAGCYEDAWVVQYAAMAGQSVAKLAEIKARSLPYFSIILVHGRGRRP